jgi:hypothetical protein
MKRHVPAATTVVALLFLLTLSASLASANMVSFQLTSDHCSGGGGCLGGNTSAGTITITDQGANTVSVNITLSSAQFVHTGFDTDIGFNLAGNPTITYSGVTSGFTPTGSNPQPVASGSGLHMDGTGFFEYGVTCTACGNGGSNPQSGPLNFTITSAGLSTASFQQNAAGQFFAVDVLGNGNTGAVDASTPTPVPDGGMTLVLLGGVLVSLETMRRRLRV